MKRLSRKQKVWAVLGTGLLVAAISGSALAQSSGDRDMLHLEIQKDHESTTAISPLPTPEPQSDIEFTGAVEVMASDMWVIGGRTVAVTAATEIKTGLAIGALAKVHALRQADGSLLASEIAPARIGSHDEDNSNTDSDDHSDDNHTGTSNENGNVNSHEDHGNSNEHDGNVNSNGRAGNDDRSGSVNSNVENSHDDHGGSVNSNDSNGEHGGHVNSNDSNDNHNGSSD